MTAISVAAPSSLQAVIPAPPESLHATRSQSTFKKVLKDLPDSDNSDEAQPTTKKKTSEKDDTSVPVAFVSAPAKLLLPVTLPRQEFRAAANEKNSPDAMDAEVLNLPKTTNDNSGSEGEIAFAARMVDSAKSLQQPAQAQPLPQAFKEPPPAERQVERPADPQKDRRPDAVENQTQPEASQPREQTTATVVAPPARDAVVSSPAPPRPPAPVQQTHAIDHVALEPSQKPATTAVNEISVRVAGPDQTTASIRLVDRSGEVMVAVRSSDTQLADALRSNVDQLSTRLNTNGWNADVWRPGSIQSAARPEASAQDTAHERHDSQPSQFRDTTRRDSQDNQQKRPNWVEEFYDRNE